MAERVLVTGANGQLGYDVIKELTKRNIECVGVDHNDFSITDKDAVMAYIKDYKPTAVIHCAAYTAVDAAEDDKELCYAVNETGSEYIAEACKAVDAKMMYISTDYVFPGTGDTFYEPNDSKGPQNVYGAAKLAGEIKVQDILDKYFIVRISWVFGVNGKNFVKTMLNLAKTHDALTVVDDQIGSPTYTADLARLLVDMIVTDKYGAYHATNEGICTWYEFACEIFKQAGVDIKVRPVTSEAFKTKAKRPLNSRMSKEALTANGFKKLPTWQEALADYLPQVVEK